VGRFEIEFSKKAAKDYKKLPKDYKVLVDLTLHKLSEGLPSKLLYTPLGKGEFNRNV
jgi:mRNA-degrading endonuclease RelE of RelBE toxin-antitoxin system